jgi:hypothetical protein
VFHDNSQCICVSGMTQLYAVSKLWMFSKWSEFEAKVCKICTTDIFSAVGYGYNHSAHARAHERAHTSDLNIGAITALKYNVVMSYR